MSWLSKGLGTLTGGLIGDSPGGGVDPRKFQQPINTGPQTLPIASGPVGGSPFSSAQQAQLQSALSAAGIWDTVQNIGGDVWGVISKILPKNADGSIDWGGALKDIGSWVKDNKDTILQGLSAVNQYQRSQKSDEYAKKALDLATKSFDEKAPLRAAGQAGMLNPQANAPDISALRAQGQNGLSLQAPTPLPLATGNLNNAQHLANGPQSSNPFTKALPLAAPNAMPSAPLRPIPPPPVSSGPPTLPIATNPQVQPPHVDPIATPQTPLPTGPLPPGAPSALPKRKIAPLPMATY